MINMPTSVVIGATGQAASFLIELLLNKGHRVIGLVRRSSSPNYWRIENVLDNSYFILEEADLHDPFCFATIFQKYKPDYIYALAAQSHVATSFELPHQTTSTIVDGTLNILQAAKLMCPKARIYIASSSEIYGDSPVPQNEDTKFNPQSPYACAKVYAHHLANVFRNSYDMHICCGILFNYESERRSPAFVTRKITLAAARIHFGLQDVLHLGNLKAKRDWTYAGDSVRAMHSILEYPTPDDYVIASGESHTVEEFLELVFDYARLDWRKYVVIDPNLFRPLEVPHLCGDSSKARTVLNWKPQVSFEELAKLMYNADYKLIKESL